MIYIERFFVNQKGALQVKTHFYDLRFNDAQGKEQSMESYKGKVILILNTPVETEKNDQLTEVDYIYEKYINTIFICSYIFFLLDKT